eukprot:6492740-Amphidinium_carterae.7
MVVITLCVEQPGLQVPILCIDPKRIDLIVRSRDNYFLGGCKKCHQLPSRLYYSWLTSIPRCLNKPVTEHRQLCKPQFVIWHGFIPKLPCCVGGLRVNYQRTAASN